MLFLAGCGWTDSSGNAKSASSEDIEKIRENLRPFLSAQRWKGDRWRITGMSDGFPVTESIGSWEVSLNPTDADGIFRLEGVSIGKPCIVELDTNLGVLHIDGVPFIGSALTGNSPVVRGKPFKGAEFEHSGLGVSGSAAILVLEEDGRVLLDFHHVRTMSSRGEYGILAPESVEEAK
jgi:hypothetical protein